MTIYIGADHAAFTFKEQLMTFLRDKGYTVEDCGNTVYDKGDDYPDFAHAVAQGVAVQEGAMGILLCDTGVGISIAANRHAGVRAALVQAPEQAIRAREHNDANVLCLGEEYVSQELAEEIVIAFLTTSFSGGERHVRRIGKIESQKL